MVVRRHYNVMCVYPHNYFVFGYSYKFSWWWVGSWNFSRQRNLWCSEPLGGYKRVTVSQSIISLILWTPWGLEFRSTSCRFDLVSTISNIFIIWFSWREVMRTTIYLDWGVIMSYNNNFIVAWLSSYNFYGGPIG